MLTGAASALLLTACAPGGHDAERSHLGADAAALSHIHGIGVDPADGSVLVATHTGLFRVEDGEPVRVGTSNRDTMGFTVVGPGHFLASGHPGEGEAGPAALGLLESTDAGRTWTSVALSGEADFHGLDASGEAVFGYDSASGALLVARDGASFTPITRGGIADIAVAPGTTEEVLATTQDGVVSIVTGTGEATARGETVLHFIDWASSTQLVGVAPDGVVRVSDDGGRNWTAGGTVPGSPAALEVSGKTWYAGSDRGLFASADQGRTWTVVASID